MVSPRSVLLFLRHNSWRPILTGTQEKNLQAAFRGFPVFGPVLHFVQGMVCAKMSYHPHFWFEHDRSLCTN